MVNNNFGEQQLCSSTFSCVSTICTQNAKQIANSMSIGDNWSVAMKQSGNKQIIS